MPRQGCAATGKAITAKAAIMADSLAHPRFSLDQKGRDTMLAMVMVLPAILYIALLLGIPIVLAVYYSLSDVTTGGSAVRFVGLGNFTELLHNPDFLGAVGNTIIITVMTLVATLILATIQAEQIGRASCRARVCQYV